METSNITLGANLRIDPSTSFNNVSIGDNTKIAKRCSVFGGVHNILEIGKDSYIGMNGIINGFAAKIIIGSNVSISQNVNIMAESGPNSSIMMQRIFPLIKGSVSIGDNCWIGASVIIMPNVTLGEFCVVAASSFVNESFPAYSILGGTPAKLIRIMTPEEIKKLQTSKS
jgi:acetyltransferase-like isoleucine patch superfamily enzyme